MSDTHCIDSTFICQTFRLVIDVELKYIVFHSPYIHPKATDLNIQLTCLEISPMTTLDKNPCLTVQNVLIKHVIFMYTLWNENRLHSLQFWLVSLAWFTWNTNLSTALVEPFMLFLLNYWIIATNWCSLIIWCLK